MQSTTDKRTQQHGRYCKTKRYQKNSLLSLHCAVSNDQNSFSVYVKNICKLDARRIVSVAHPLIPVAA